VKRVARILLLGGPAGVGKSNFASCFLSSQGWKHLELDEYSGGSVDSLLRPGWDDFFCRHEPVRLHKELLRRPTNSENLVVTPTGLTLFDPDHISAARDLFHIAYLWGSPEDCLRSFLERERRTGRGLTGPTWLFNNERVYFWLDLPFNKLRRVNAFADDGSRRPDSDILLDLERLMA
jgi:hypothetical protein